MNPLQNEAAYFSKQVRNTRRFYDPGWQSRAQDGGTSLVGGGCEWCAPDFVVGRQRFPFLAFEFIRKGTGHVTLSGTTHPVTAGCAYLFDGTIPHRIESDAADPLVKFFFNFQGPAIRDLLTQLQLQIGDLWQVLDPARIAALLEEAIDHTLSGSAYSQLAALKSIEHALANAATLRLHSQQTADPVYNTFLRCRDHLLRHYPRLTSIEESAAECHVTASYLTRLFKRHGTESPHQCLTRLKMSQALVLLQEPDTQVKAVAHELGFKSPAHFSRAYKAWHGYPPTAVPKQVHPGQTLSL